jgi:hypothetical protein
MEQPPLSISWRWGGPRQTVGHATMPRSPSTSAAAGTHQQLAAANSGQVERNGDVSTSQSLAAVSSAGSSALGPAGSETVYLRQRHGFVRLAIATGAPLVSRVM